MARVTQCYNIVRRAIAAHFLIVVNAVNMQSSVTLVYTTHYALPSPICPNSLFEIIIKFFTIFLIAFLVFSVFYISIPESANKSLS